MKVKEKLLSTATRLFHTQGYNTTGINQIISEAGIAKGSFYYNFKSKEDLCIAFLNSRHDHWFGQLKQYISDGQARRPILLAFDFLLKMNEDENFRGCSFLNILSEIDNSNSKILEVIQNHKIDLRNYFSSLVEDKQLVNHIYLLFESALIESQLFKNQLPVYEARRIVESLINK